MADSRRPPPRTVRRVSLGEAVADLGFLAALVVPVVKNEVLLRVVTLGSSLCFFLSSVVPYPNVNWAAIGAQLVLIARGTNLFFRSIAERRLAFSAWEIELYHNLFEDLKLHEFRALLDCGAKTRVAQDGEVLVAEDSLGADFGVLTGGECRVESRGQIVDVLTPGDCFGNELSVAAMQKHPTVATESIIAAGTATYIKWNTDALLQMMAEKVAIRAAIFAIVARDEARRIVHMDWNEVRELKRKWYQPKFLPAVPPEHLPRVIADNLRREDAKRTT
ncbi:hypothetical protein CTAYLR_009573 [Chrysophaeum taylorii]|uniref:Cyclic nucleotide-binding domain-containing protein n=1 Tax=Chrysophaeum taylorii TaxID=2483200 RepID=A0AAD7UNW0_9STRA|nr:hypothetical protein CTAYLR_009573 [Chrysophaeum taylorii]